MDKVLTSSKNMGWQTPEWYLQRVRQVAPIGLDPCTTTYNPTKAEVYFHPEKHSGIYEDWDCYGLVFVNPPYGRELSKWAAKIVYEARAGVEMVVLVPSRTDTVWYNKLLDQADATLHHRKRIKFVDPDTGTAKDAAAFPSATFYFGLGPDRFKRAFRDLGTFVMVDFAGRP